MLCRDRCARCGDVDDAAGAGVSWVAVCLLDRIAAGRGVAAVLKGAMVAVFRVADDQLYAIDHVDPVTHAPVLARGRVADVDGRPVVVSPAGAHRYDLRTGACLDDPALGVRTWPVRIIGRVIEIDTSALAACAPAGTPVSDAAALVRSMSTRW
jgi:nitrite reductase (NADH) small subunit